MKVIISGGFSGAYEKLLPEFEQASGIKVTTGSGASQGDGPQTIGAQLARGEKADVVILSREGLDGLIAANASPPAPTSILRTVGIGVAVRRRRQAGSGTVDAIKQRCSRREAWRPGKHLRHLAGEGAVSQARHRRTINVKVSPRGAGDRHGRQRESRSRRAAVSEILHDKGVELAACFRRRFSSSRRFRPPSSRRERARRQASDRISDLRAAAEAIKAPAGAAPRK
jgi:molybdate transport system substrate-binding protein